MTHTVSLISYESHAMSHKIGSRIPFGVINIMKRFCPTMERSSIDECYLDLTEISRRYKNATDKSQLPNCWLSGCETIEESVEAIIDSGPGSALRTSIRTVPSGELW